MPPRGDSALSDESHKENRGRISKNSADKPNMNGKARAARVDTDSDGEQVTPKRATNRDPVSDEEEDDVEHRSPRGNKRARANTNGDSRAVKSEGKGKARLNPKVLQRDTDGYVAGSIVRIQLKNFVTYDYVEFSPGPHLNMVLGPNGTGKSSIACAICLGLNFPPALLGRQDLDSFVKQTKDKGHIEIELKGLPGKPNIVIRRDLVQKSKNTTFTINGRQASGRDVNSRIAELNIQVSNLCTFLPQDRVSEFARMTPQQLLRETERAAGDENLTQWHEALISSGRELKNLQEVLNDEREQLKTAQDRNAALEKEVKRYEERQTLERRLELLEIILPWAEYNDAKKEYAEAKEERSILTKEIARMKKKNAPMLALKTQLEREETRATEERKAKTKTIKDTHTQMLDRHEKFEKITTSQEDCYSKLTILKQEERERQKKISELERTIARLERERDNPPQHEDAAVVDAELARARAKFHKVKEDLGKLEYQVETNVDGEGRIKGTIQRLQADMQRLDNESHRKLQHLQGRDADCADTVSWLRQNQHQFQFPVMEPPIMSMTVTDQRYAASVESLFSWTQLKTFVCQCDEDYRLLMRLVADQGSALGRRAKITGWYKRQEDPPRVPMDREKLHEYGFDGYAMDYIECPEPLRWYLQSTLHLHGTPIALDPRRVDQNKATAIVNNNGGGRFIAGNILHSVTRSNYGRRLASSMTKEIQAARNFGKADVDPSIKRGIEQQIKDAEINLQVAKEATEKLHGDMGALHLDHDEMKKHLNAAEARKKKILDAQRAMATLSTRLDNAQNRLANLRSAPSAEAERENVKKQIDKHTLAKFAALKDYLKLVHRYERAMEEASNAGLRGLHCTSDKENLIKEFEARNQELKEAFEKYQIVDKKYERAKTVSKQKLDVSRGKIDAVAVEVKDDFKKLEAEGVLAQMDVPKVEAEIQEVNAELEMNLATNRGVIEQFQKRKEEIEALTNSLADREQKAEKVELAIKIAKEKWDPALRVLVDDIGSKFSSAFDRIGCAGEIRISPHEDYDKWAIDILVKFRDTEKLQLLTAQRQSGGERSLTTILYLMSLTEQARSPFSLVDEINQGMDQRAERAVHDQLVDVTCNSDVGQYFLITPKLLPNLMYHERMKVLCVNNGEWLPDDNRLGNMMNMVEGFVNKQRST